jgi:ATP-dependent helicase/DNAse subunit B
VPLTLVTGPANAAKARVVLDRYREALEREPILVVPTFPDVDHYRRELAASGTVFGTNVLGFGWLAREIGRRTGSRARPVGRLTADRVVAAAVAAASLRRLAAAARTPGFGEALARLVLELGELRVDPPRFTRALRDWAGEDMRRREYADEVAALFAGYRRELERLGRADSPMATAAALDALRLDPARWGETPVFFYGFDDLTPLQLDTVETLAVRCGADVTFSLTYEAGREATAARAGTYEDLRALGATEVQCAPRAEHYAPASREALHAIERGLHGEVGESPGPVAARPPAGEAVLFLEGGGERAEAELVAGRVAQLIAGGMAPEDIAVAHRGVREAGALLDAVFGSYEIPIALHRRLAAGHTALGRGVIALLRCAVLDGSADDLLAYLRTPGLLDRPGLADRLEAAARQEGIRTAAGAREAWEREHWPLDALDRVRAAGEQSAKALCERLAAEAARLFAAPFRGLAPVLEGAELADAKATAALRVALRELAGLPAGLVPEPRELAHILEHLEVHLGDPPGPGRVTVASPLALRARRVKALFCMGLNEGVFPAPGRPEPFFGDEERRAINAASGLRLRGREDALRAERFLLYAMVSRPTELLACSWRTADDEGTPAVRSLFVDDIEDLLADVPLERRELGAVGWPEGQAPTAREAARAFAAAAPPAAAPPISALSDPAVLGELAQRHTWSASAIEAWTSCPVKWFVERMLRPEQLVPDPEPMVRGALAHKVLEHALSRLVAGGGLTPDRLDEARVLLHEALEQHADEIRISVNPQRLKAQLRRLEVDLIAYLEYAAGCRTTFTPSEFEVSFGGASDALPALELFDGELRLAGKIDRVDRRGAEAIVYDYKGKTASAGSRWLQDGKLQVGLYMLAVRQVLGARAAGGFYQPLGSPEPQPRGVLLEDVDPDLDMKGTDRVDEAKLNELLDGCAVAARAAVAAMRAGRLEPSPDSCGWNGSGCQHPSICRCATA